MASRGVNKVILIGNVGQDPEVRFTPNGVGIANVRLATSESWKDQNGQTQERTEWHRVVMYRRLAEIVGEYVKKGAKIYIEGKLSTRKWQDKEGRDHYTTEIIADEMQMLDSRPGGGDYQGNGGGRNYAQGNGGGGYQGNGGRGQQQGGSGWGGSQGSQQGGGNYPQGNSGGSAAAAGWAGGQGGNTPAPQPGNIAGSDDFGGGGDIDDIPF